MSGRRPFKDLTKDFAPERRQRIEALKIEFLAGVPQHELRRTKKLAKRNPSSPLKVNRTEINN